MRRKRVWFSIGIVVVLALGTLLAFNLSPRPGVVLIRFVFERDVASIRRELDSHAPTGVSDITDQQYRAGDADAYLDVYFPEAAAQPGVQLPTVIWTHGGAWVSGSKEDFTPYFQLIAVEGYTVIALGYSLAPDEQYPTPVEQVNAALAYIQQNAERFHVDVDRIVMAGDSAGAQITSQVAALTTNPAVAGELEITPSLQPDQLRGVVLYCGIYDMDTFMERANVTSGILRWGMKTSIWAYTGSRDPDTIPLRQMSTVNHATSDFPPAFISGGHTDPLTDAQSRPLATRLEELGVEVTTLFFPPDHEPDLGHEYQFKLNYADAQDALVQMLAFIKQYVSE